MPRQRKSVLRPSPAEAGCVQCFSFIPVWSFCNFHERIIHRSAVTISLHRFDLHSEAVPVRYTKSLFAIPFVTWVCFILGSRIVISAERKPCIVRLSSSTRGCDWRNGFRSAFFSLRCQTVPPVHANDQASGHGQIEAGIQSLLFRCHRIDHQCVFSCI